MRSFVVGICLNWFELEVGYYDADIISSEFEIGEISDLRGVLFVSIVLFPASLAFIDKSTGRGLPVFVLLDKTADFRRIHDVPATVRANHDESVGLLQL